MHQTLYSLISVRLTVPSCRLQGVAITFTHHIFHPAYSPNAVSIGGKQLTTVVAEQHEGCPHLLGVPAATCTVDDSCFSCSGSLMCLEKSLAVRQ